MADLLDHAKDAIYQQNWSAFDACLAQLAPSHSDSSVAALTGDTSDGQARSLRQTLDVLAWGDFQTQWEVAKLLPCFGEAAIPELVKFLQDERVPPEAHWFAARSLGAFDSPAAVAALVELLQETEDEALTTIASEALSQIGTSAIDALANLLYSPETRAAAARSLAQIRRVETITPLLTVVHDPDSAIRALAIEAIGSFHDARVPPALIQALDDPASAVRKAAIVGLSVRPELATEQDLVQRLRDRLRDWDLSVCQQAAIGLGRIGTDDAIAALAQVLHAPHTPELLQQEIVRALGWAGSAAALSALRQALAQGDAAIRAEAVAVLGRWAEAAQKPQAAEMLVDALRDDRPDERPQMQQAIALALGQLGQPLALEPLIHLLAEPDAGVRLHAIAALKRLDATLANERLQTLIAQPELPEPLQQGIAIALEEW